MKHRRILFGLLLSLPLVLAGGAFVNSATTAEPVEVGATTSTYYVDYGGYIAETDSDGNALTFYVYAWSGSGTSETKQYGDWPGAAVGSETYPNAITVDTTTNVATINLDSAAEKFIVHNNSSQTPDIVVSDASGVGNRYVIYGSTTDDSGKTTLNGTWVADNSSHKDATDYIALSVDYYRYQSNLPSVYVHYFDYDTEESKTTWPGEFVPETSITDYVATVYVPTPTSTASTGKFIIDSGSGGWQTVDITYTSARAGDTFILSGLDSYYTTNGTGAWLKDASTTWTITGTHNSWATSGTDATAGTEGGEAVEVKLAEAGKFKIINGTTYGIYEINTGTLFNFGGTSQRLGAKFEYFENWDGTGDITVKSGYGGTYKFTFGSGFYRALCAGRDVTNLLTITYAATTDIVITYARVIEAGYYGSTATIQGASSETVNSVKGELYGYTFGGWYFDKNLTNAVGTDYTFADYKTASESSGAFWLFAKFTANEGHVTYTLDYGNYLGDEAVISAKDTTPVVTTSSVFYVHYWGTPGNSGEPGIRLTADNGLATISVPSDATGMNVLAYTADVYQASGQWILQTDDITVTPASDTETARMKFLTTYYTTASSDLRIQVGTADAGYDKVYDALTTVAGQCSTSYAGTAATDAMDTAWATIKDVVDTSSASEPDTTSENYTAYISHLGGMASRVDASDNRANGMAGLMSVYDYIIGKYTTLADPLGRKATTTDPVSAIRLDTEEAEPYIALIAFVSASALIIGSYIFIKKKLEKRIEE